MASLPTKVETNPWKLLVIHIDIDGPNCSGMDRGKYDFRLYLDNGEVKATPLKRGDSIEKLEDVKLTVSRKEKDGNVWTIDVSHKKFSISIQVAVDGEDPNHLLKHPTSK